MRKACVRWAGRAWHEKADRNQVQHGRPTGWSPCRGCEKQEPAEAKNDIWRQAVTTNNQEMNNEPRC